MTIIDLSKVRDRQAERHVLISWVEQIGDDGEVYREPFYDLDDEGEPRYYGFDEEPRDPTAEEFASGNYIFSVSPSEFAETAIKIAEKGDVNNFSFDERPYLRRIYDTGTKQTLLKCGRQVEKSTTLGNKMIGYSCLNNHFRSLYVGPSAEQAKVFSNDRIADVITVSPSVRAYTNTFLTNAVFHKKFINYSQIRLRYAYLTADRVRGIPADLICYDKNAEVLTKLGWTPVKSLKSTDLVADVNDAGVVEWNAPTKIFAKNYCGEMVTFNHAGINLRVTGDHNMWVNYHVKSSKAYKAADHWEFVKAVDLALTDRMGFKMTCGADWSPSNKETKHFPQWSVDQRVANQYGRFGKTRTNTYPGLDLPYDAFAELVGWYLAEGSIQRGEKGSPLRRPIITQNPGQHFDDIVECIEECGLTWSASTTESGGRRIVVNSQILGEYFDLLGGSYEKYIPREFFDHPEVLPRLLKGLWGGDAMYHPEEDWDEGTLKTRSRRLAEDAQEAWLRAGRPAVIHTRMVKPIGLNSPDQNLDVEPLPMYEVCAYKRDYFIFWRSEFVAKERVGIEKVDGEEVYCFSVKNHRPIVKGGFGQKPLISGQCVDEIQDILVDNLPVIEECASHSEWKLFIYSGTPKSLDNTLEHYWANFSTQNEWVVPCKRHGTPKNPSSWHWNILDEDNIGKEGLICDRCHEPIDPYCLESQWASLNPQTKTNKEKVTFEGYRIPQIMVPWILLRKKGWAEILQKVERYPRQKLFNEVLGISYDSGTRPITRGQLKACCKSDIRLGDYEHFRKITSGKKVFAGIDWGCHDEETRILTQDGWKYFLDLTDDDLVAQWDVDTRVMSLVKPEVRTIRDWNGPLYHFETKGGLDMMLTGTHRMRVGNQYGTRWVTEPADKTVQRGGNIKFVGHVDWEGVEQKTFTLPGLPKSPGYQGCEPITFMMDDWLEFSGYILSEGGVCLRKNVSGDVVPYHLKMSQRESVSADRAEKIKLCMDRMSIPYSEFQNPETGDLNWSINGKQFWYWFAENMGYPGDQKRIPRQFLALSRRQLQILFDAMVMGDGYTDLRDGCDSGAYYSTSKRLCEDFQELCIRVGRRCLVRLHKPAEGNRKTRWRAMWSYGRDYQLNTPRQRIEKVPYNGKVYCCKVPSGYIVTERNGCVAYQGNTGENTFTVISLGAYIGTGNFTIFWTHRFVGQDLEPPIQLDRIRTILSQFNVELAGCDYGGGFDRNDHLIRAFGPEKIFKYQYNHQQKKGKVYWEQALRRFAVHRTEVMSDIFNALIRRQIDLPHWDDFFDPYGKDILSIFSEKNERQRMIEYKHSPGSTDDTFHSILLCVLVSMIKFPRPDILTPDKDSGFGDS